MPGLGLGLAAVTRESFMPSDMVVGMEPSTTYVWELEWGSGNIKPLAAMPGDGSKLWDVDLSTDPDTLQPKLLSDIANDGYFDLEGSDISPLEQTAGDAYSVALDGVDDYFTADGAGSEISGDVGSLSVWFKLDTTVYVPHFYEIWVNDNNTIRGYYHGGPDELRCDHIGGGTEGNCNTSGLTLENNGWHHLAHTWDTSANESKMYVDGSLIETSTAADFTGTISSINVGVRGHGWSSVQWPGNVNDMAFFDDVLTAGEASAIYNSGAPKDESDHSGLVGYWKFEENTGTSIADSSSNSNVATLVNGTAFSTDTP